jgi:predicted aspartyl protease
LNSFLSKVAEQGVHATRTMRFVGHIAGMDVLALLDSGSSNSSVSTTVASALPNVVELDKPVNVQIANGSCAAPAKLWKLPGP